MSWVFTNSPGDLSSIPGQVIPKTQKMELDAAWLTIQHYKERMEKSKEWSSALPYTDYGHQFYLLDFLII